MAMEAMIAMMATVIMSSMRVKPRALRMQLPPSSCSGHRRGSRNAQAKENDQRPPDDRERREAICLS
jgi:ribosomal protein L19E